MYRVAFIWEPGNYDCAPMVMRPSRTAHRTDVQRADARVRRGCSAAATARDCLPAERGFTLLEILVVIALIAAVGVLSATAMTGGMDGIRLRSAAKQVAAQLRFTRAQAIATGRPQRFTIDPAAHRWAAPKDRRGDIPKQLGIAFTGARATRPARGVGAILFFADGASTGGRIQLSAKNAAWNVDVAWLTGQVSLQRGEWRQ